MSLGLPFSPDPRHVEDQVRSLIKFLAARSHALTAEQANFACTGLPDAPKAAAKELRGRLKESGIDIQHTHALNAVTQMRGSRIPAHVAQAKRWDVAAWFNDAPSVSAKRRLHTKLSDAVEDACARIKDQFEPGDKPLLRLHSAPTHIELVAVGDPSPHWHVLMVATSADGQPIDFPAEEVPRIAERLRRLLAGPIGGWLDITLGGEVWESDVLAAWSLTQDDAPLPAQPVDDLFKSLGNIPQPKWDAVRKRYAAFCDRLSEPFDMWLQSQHETAYARFAPVPFRAAVAEDARQRLNITVSELEAGIGVKDLDWSACIESASLPSFLFAAVALLLQLESPNQLTEEVRSTPRIPLFSADDLATWISRMDAELVRYPDDPTVSAALERQLVHLAGLPNAKRKSWAKAPPAELQRFAQSVAGAGLVLCASMEKRFVQDLPLGRWRMGMVSALSFESEAVVRAQPSMQPAADDAEPITEEWLKRFNEPVFTGEDLVEFSKQVEERRESDGSENFDIAMITAARLFGKSPGKAHAATVRMQAVSRLIEHESLEPWILPSTEGGASMLSRPVFEAAARCPLVDIAGNAGFEFHRFAVLCAQYADREAAS